MNTQKWGNFGEEQLIPKNGEKLSRWTQNWDASRPCRHSWVLPGPGIIYEDLAAGIKGMFDNIKTRRKALNFEYVQTVDRRIKFKYFNDSRPYEIRSFADFDNLINNTQHQGFGRDGCVSEAECFCNTENLLGISIWNFNGLKYSKMKTIEDTENDFFRDILKRNHIICFSKRWRDKTDNKDFSLNNNFSEYHELGFRNHRVGTASGGMSLLVQKPIIRPSSYSAF